MIKIKTMKPQLNKYFFGRLRNAWGIWQWTTADGTQGTFIQDAYSYEEAVTEVYRLNGWGTPKNIKRTF